MVAVIEVVVLAVLAALGLGWFRRTALYRAHRRSGVGPGQYGSRAGFGMYQPSNPPPLPDAVHGQERLRRSGRRRDS